MKKAHQTKPNQIMKKAHLLLFAAFAATTALTFAQEATPTPEPSPDPYREFVHSVVLPANTKFPVDMNATSNQEEFAEVVSSFYKTDLIPEELTGPDSRLKRLYASLHFAARTAARVGDPEALNWALAAYRAAPMNHQRYMDYSIATVASALKAQDFNLVRANAWIEGQNTGEPSVTFTPEELAIPAVLEGVPSIVAHFDWPTQLAERKEGYRVANSSKTLDIQIYAIATVLKGHDLNLARANAWIESQKSGTEFDLVLDNE